MTDDTIVVAALAALVAAVAGARSTWSPCGVSMLATITPLAERGRGHRYRATATWFVAGSVAGGAMLGAFMAALATGVHAAGPATTTLLALAGGAAALAAASDSRVGGFRLPVHHRQVNERWLDQFRPWVYGAGFGWQIGSGLATYIKTTAVYLMIVLAALTGNPWVALAAGVLFGLVRGVAVFLGHRITAPDVLARFHRRVTALDPVARALTVVTEAAVAVLCAALVSPWAGLVVALASVGVALLRARARVSTASARAAGTART